MSQSGQGSRHPRVAGTRATTKKAGTKRAATGRRTAKRTTAKQERVAESRQRARLRAARRLASTQDFTSAVAPDACVIIIAGHRNATNGGAPGEMARTPKLARAYRDALRAAGFTVFYVQELDKDGDPDTFAGNLTAVAATVRALAAGFSGKRLIMLDLHLEEGGAPAGVFTIVPDDPTGKSADVWKNNADAVTLGHLLSERIAARAGFKQRAAKELGVMSERQTGVGESGGRLGMFRGTAALRDRMTRLIVEHGNIVKDRAVIDRPQTPALCASAAVEAVSTFLGVRPPVIMA